MTAQNTAQPSLFAAEPAVAPLAAAASDTAPLERTGCGHWGWGAWMVSTPSDDWTCPRCGRKKGRGKWKVGMHTYPFGEPCCTDCARAWHDSYCDRSPFG